MAQKIGMIQKRKKKRKCTTMCILDTETIL